MSIVNRITQLEGKHCISLHKYTTDNNSVKVDWCGLCNVLASRFQAISSSWPDVVFWSGPGVSYCQNRLGPLHTVSNHPNACQTHGEQLQKTTAAPEDFVCNQLEMPRTVVIHRANTSSQWQSSMATPLTCIIILQLQKCLAVKRWSYHPIIQFEPLIKTIISLSFWLWMEG